MEGRWNRRVENGFPDGSFGYLLIRGPSRTSYLVHRRGSITRPDDHRGINERPMTDITRSTHDESFQPSRDR